DSSRAPPAPQRVLLAQVGAIAADASTEPRAAHAPLTGAAIHRAMPGADVAIGEEFVGLLHPPLQNAFAQEFEIGRLERGHGLIVARFAWLFKGYLGGGAFRDGSNLQERLSSLAPPPGLSSAAWRAETVATPQPGLSDLAMPVYTFSGGYHSFAITLISDKKPWPSTKNC
ncbi:MAG: hypothetical protein D6770_10210, partial [Anaerolineae bacterium]